MPSLRTILGKYNQNQNYNTNHEKKPRISRHVSPLPFATFVKDSPYRIFVVPDAHVPRQEPKAWITTLGLLRDFNPHAVVIIGDFGDFESISHHPKNRPDLVKLSFDYDVTNHALDELQNCTPSADWYYLEGNHEYRIVKFINEHGLLDGLLNLPERLYLVKSANPRNSKVDLRGMKWIPFRSHIRSAFVAPWGIGYLHSAKGNTKWSGGGLNHARYHADNVAPISGVKLVVYGHHHTFQYYRNPAQFEAWCCGFLGDFDADEPAFDYAAGPSPWVTGVMVQEVSGPLVTTTPIYIRNGKAILNGKIY